MTTTKWLNCRLRDLQTQLAAQGHPASLMVIRRLLRQHGYRLRLNRKQLAEVRHPERDTQFQQIQTQRRVHQAAGQPIISVDTKKKELLGNFRNAGRCWGRAPELVNQHDFETDALGRAVPYGVYDVGRNAGTVYVGQSADTPSFAVDNVARWCAQHLGVEYPQATALLILADSGGSNSARSRVWKAALQEQVVDRFGLTVTVCHYPPGASKWNPIEHRLFSEISKTWAGCPLRSWDVLMHYLRQTTTTTGLRVEAAQITTAYATGEKVDDAAMARLKLERHTICPAWNYTLRPRTRALAA